MSAELDDVALRARRTAGLIPWRKGQSGNPGGRGSLAANLRKRCREIVDKHVVDFWKAQVVDNTVNAVKCSELLAHYGYGKPKELPDAEPDDTSREPTVEESEAAAARLREEMG